MSFCIDFQDFVGGFKMAAHATTYHNPAPRTTNVKSNSAALTSVLLLVSCVLLYVSLASSAIHLP